MSDTKKQPLTAKYRDELLAERDTARAEVERLKTLAALRCTEEWPPDVDYDRAGYTSETYSRGFEASHQDFGGPGGMVKVDEMWSSTVSHGWGDPARPGRSGSRGAKRLHSTPERALRALRHQLERKYAAHLREVDRAIAAEVAKEREQGQALTEALS